MRAQFNVKDSMFLSTSDNFVISWISMIIFGVDFDLLIMKDLLMFWIEFRRMLWGEYVCWKPYYYLQNFRQNFFKQFSMHNFYAIFASTQLQPLHWKLRNICTNTFFHWCRFNYWIWFCSLLCVVVCFYRSDYIIIFINWCTAECFHL